MPIQATSLLVALVDLAVATVQARQHGTQMTRRMSKRSPNHFIMPRATMETVIVVISEKAPPHPCRGHQDLKRLGSVREENQWR